MVIFFALLFIFHFIVDTSKYRMAPDCDVFENSLQKAANWLNGLYQNPGSWTIVNSGSYLTAIIELAHYQTYQHGLITRQDFTLVVE